MEAAYSIQNLSGVVAAGLLSRWAHAPGKMINAVIQMSSHWWVQVARQIAAILRCLREKYKRVCKRFGIPIVFVSSSVTSITNELDLGHGTVCVNDGHRILLRLHDLTLVHRSDSYTKVSESQPKNRDLLQIDVLWWTKLSAECHSWEWSVIKSWCDKDRLRVGEHLYHIIITWRKGPREASFLEWIFRDNARCGIQSTMDIWDDNMETDQWLVNDWVSPELTASIVTPKYAPSLMKREG